MSNKLSILWFLIHFGLEVICFQFYGFCFGDPVLAAVMALIYDIIAFFPQFLIGTASQKHPKLPLGKLGAVLVLLGASTAFFEPTGLHIAGLIVLSAGNAFVHVGGAEATLYTCRDRIAPSAVFIAGGAFGVVTGRLLGTRCDSVLAGMAAMLCAACLIVYADKLRKDCKRTLPTVRMANPERSLPAVILLAFFVVTVRGLLAYGLPTSWNQTPTDLVLLFCMMGTGKAAGGICSDLFGARKTALLSSACSVPLLLLGDDHMVVSLIGIALFSMTTASTLGILVSATPEMPLTAYGMTTLGLLLGTVPTMFPGVTEFLSQGWVLTVLSALCCAALWYIMIPDPAPRHRGHLSAKES